MNREYHRWYSPRLNREMELLLYGHAGEPVLLFPTSAGRFFQAEDFGLIGSIGDRLERGRYVVACVDSVDHESWMNRSAHPHDRVLRHEQYERYILDEVLPLLWSKSTGGRLTIAGCSLGGFHAVNIGFRRPDAFHRVLSMGGMFDGAEFLDGYHDARVFFHSVFQWLPNAPEWHLDGLRRTEIILAAGEHDYCRGSNEALSGLLWSRGVGNHYSSWNGESHDWPVWRQMIATYLPH